ncbi:hypothetical protein GCM10010967_56730 [Dyadobacter beijingensis]|uniref:Baseplate J-like protein n=1 Tax=Dyadobacter beijingensis TaxID=365489 RepID=A0ABQ2IN10_9BACT|nr:hypothetical protein GCM10010967_56730 [Dyadobacter beijingensis]
MALVAHPLARSGTTQQERLLKALIPENLQLDGRNMAELLAFAGKFARQIRYWSPDNTPDGDWTCFFEKDATTLLAIIAATPLQEIRLDYRQSELDFVQACRQEKQAEGKSACDQAIDHLYPLVDHIFAIAQKLLDICEKFPPDHPLKAESQALIKEKLGIRSQNGAVTNFNAPIGLLISYHKTVHAKLGREGKVIDLYAPFFRPTPCAEAWGIDSHDFLNCINFHAPLEEADRERLWRLFLIFYKALSWVVGKAEKAFQTALHGRSDHPPHIALLLAFLQLFRRYHQSDMNSLLSRHLLFYYQGVLRLQQRREIPDKVHIAFEIAQNIETYRLQKDTLLLGGQDVNGLDRLYALADELVVNQAKLIEKQNLYFFQGTAIALRKADQKDGIKTPYEAGQKLWQPLSGLDLFRKWRRQTQMFAFKKVAGKEELAFSTKLRNQIETITANPGLIITSPELWLAGGGDRTITISFAADAPIELNKFYTEISTAEGVYTFPLDFNRQEPTEPEVLLANRKFPLRSTYVHHDNITIWNIQLPADFVSISSPRDTQANIGDGNPFITLRLKDDSNYDAAARIHLSKVGILTQNQRLRNVSVQLGSTPYVANADIPLIGSMADVTTLKLYVTAPELAVKTGKATLNVPIEGLDGQSKELTLTGTRQKLTAEEFEKPVPYVTTTPYPFFTTTISIKKGPENAPIQIFKIASEAISLEYISTEQQPQLYWRDFLGGYSKVPELDGSLFTIVPLHRLPELDKPLIMNKERGAPLLDNQNAAAGPAAAAPTPSNTADGSLRLGFEALQPGQTLSLLFHFADGTGNPDHIAPDEIVWAYLRQNEWVRLPPQFILIDETLGMRQTGILRLQIPFDINNGNTLALGEDGRQDLFWIQASASEDPGNNIFVDALPMLKDIFPQAGTAIFLNRQNDLAHLPDGLPAQTITALRFRDANVVKVDQPFQSFDGRLSENFSPLDYHRRIHERLRHKQRAVTLWDYERMTLEQFPKVALAKCITHTRDTDVTRPGYVTLGVVPFPNQMVGNRRYYPIFNAGVLEAIERFLNRHNTYFVSHQGGGVKCCGSDESGCGCAHEGGLLVRNAIFEPVRLQVCVKFREGRDPFFYKKQLDTDLKIFLAPWATDSRAPLVFGTTLYTVELLRVLENLNYVDVIMGLKVKHFPSMEMAEIAEDAIAFEVEESITPFTARSILTTYLDVLNEDNPNTIDHDILVIEGTGCCADCDDDNLKKANP